MKEMDALYEVFQTVRRKWKTEVHQTHNYTDRMIDCIFIPKLYIIYFCSFLIKNVMFLGDLNAACSYVTKKGLKNVRLRSDPRFHWLIRDEQDTTVRETTHCAYDRSDFLSKPTQQPQEQ